MMPRDLPQLIFIAVCATALLVPYMMGASAQFTAVPLPGEVCRSASDSNGGEYPFINVTAEIINSVVEQNITLYDFLPSYDRPWVIECVQVFEHAPTDLPDTLAEVCAPTVGSIALAFNSSEPVLVSMDGYLHNPLQKLEIGGKEMQLDGVGNPYTMALTWLPTRVYPTSCYPRTFRTFLTAGVKKKDKAPMIAYIIVGVVGGILAIIAIGVFSYLLYRRMNSHVMRGELAASSDDKNGRGGSAGADDDAEPYGPGDEGAGSERSRAAHARSHMPLAVEMASYNPAYTTNEVEVEKGVFTSQRVATYGPLGHQYKLEAMAAAEAYPSSAANDPYPQMVDGNMRAASYPASSSQPQSGRPSAPSVIVPASVNGIPSAELYGVSYEDVSPTRGPQVGVVEVSGPNGTTSQVPIVSVPLRRPWYDKYSNGDVGGAYPNRNAPPPTSSVGAHTYGAPHQQQGMHHHGEAPAYTPRSNRYDGANNHGASYGGGSPRW